MFTSIDPLWEKYYGWTPYHYCGNDPVNMVDANGKFALEFNNLNDARGYAKSSSGNYDRQNTSTLGLFINYTCYENFKVNAPNIASAIKNLNVGVARGEIEDGSRAQADVKYGLIEFNKDTFLKETDLIYWDMGNVVHEYVHLSGGEEYQAFSAQYAFLVNAGRTIEATGLLQMYFSFINDEDENKYAREGMPTNLESKVLEGDGMNLDLGNTENVNYLKEHMLKTGNEINGSTK